MINPCYYCGEPADSVDHARPQSLDRALQALDAADRALVISRQPRRELVPACRDCNSVLGKKWFGTLAERRAYVKERLRARNARLLGSPSWSKDEIDTLGRTLRSAVELQQRKREVIQRRLAW